MTFSPPLQPHSVVPLASLEDGGGPVMSHAQSQAQPVVPEVQALLPIYTTSNTKNKTCINS